MGTDFSDYIDFMNLNDSELEAWDGERRSLPPGEYVFEITDIESGQSSKGNPQLTITNKVVVGSEEGRTMRSWFVMTQTQGARARLLNLLKATNVSPDGRGGFHPQSLLGRRYKAKVIEDQYDETNALGEKVPRTTFRIQGESPVQ